MRAAVAMIVCLLMATCAVAQVNLDGIVIDKSDGEPIAGASVILKGGDGKIKKFAATKADGRFAMTAPDVKGFSLEVSMMGYSKQVLAADSITYPATIMLQSGMIELKEVAVKADRIREQGDTITYNVGSFAQTQDRSIGDVLKRMPGISVEKSGKIQYQGEDINKFYIEGSDLLGGKYGIATNGINHEDVGAVEVMENHQPMQVLSGISFSDMAAINLKLKNRSKATWTVHGNAGAGYSEQPEGMIWNGELFAMAVMSGFQNITTLKSNNTGEDLSGQATDFFATRRGTALSRYVEVALPSVPGLRRKRTLFNRSVLVSSNGLWKYGRGELKAQIDYSFNRVGAGAANITTYYLSGGNRVVTENRDGSDRSHSLSGKVTYELNGKTTFVNNTLRTNLDWDDVRLNVTGSINNGQTASLPDYFVANELKLIKRFNRSGGKNSRISKMHLVTFQSSIEWESLPQTLSVANDADFMRQRTADHAFYTRESAAYSFSVKGVTVSLEGGVKGYLRSMKSEAEGKFLELTGNNDEMTNVVNTNYFTTFVTPGLEYWIRRVNLVLSAPMSFAHYSFSKALANRNEVYCSPSVAANWKPDNRFSISARGGIGRAPMDLDLIHSGLMVTDYRSLVRGTDEFYNSTSSHISANLSYKHTRKGVFANATVLQSWSKMPYTMVQQLYGDYVVYSYAAARSDGKMTMAGGNIGKTLDFIRGSAKITGSVSRSESHLISENREVNSVSSSWAMGGKINGAPLKWLGFDYAISFSASRLAIEQTKNSWLDKLQNTLLITVLPHAKWEWELSGEHYRNELSAGSYKNVVLFDTRVSFKTSKRIELSMKLSNILNQKTYNYITYSQLSSFESQRMLRGRELLITVYVRK